MLPAPQPVFDVAAHVEMVEQSRLLEHVTDSAFMYATHLAAALPGVARDDEPA